MLVGSIFKRLWAHPLMAEVADVDDADRLPIFRRIIQAKPLLRDGYRKWYEEFLPSFRETASLQGDLLEVGCGPGSLEDFIPGLVKTDSVPNPFASRYMDAMQLDYPDSSLRAIYAIGVLHHLTHPERFLAEAQRCLLPSGRLVLVEPSKNYLKRTLKYFNHYEIYDDTVTTWDNPEAGNMKGANLALPWVIFLRDRAIFDQRFPSLSIKTIHYHTFMSHFLAGAMMYRSFVPAFANRYVFDMESALEPYMERLGTMMTIDIEKSPGVASGALAPSKSP